MAVNPDHQHVSCNYLGDDGNTYAIVTTRNHASAAGMSGAAPGTPSVPRGWKPRHLNLVTPDGLQKAKLVLSSPLGFVGVIGATININSLGSFVVTGTSGERAHRGAPSL
jgi:hypothetical protein